MLTLADYAHHALSQSSYRLGKHATTLQDCHHPDHIEAVHQTRVGLRRLRTTLEVFGFALDLPPQLSVQYIQKMASSLGQVRDLDVLQVHLQANLLPHLPDSEALALQAFVPKLQNQRAKRWRKAQNRLGSAKYAHFDQALHTWLAGPKCQPIAQTAILTLVPDLLLPLLSRLLLHPGWLVVVPQTSTDWENLHGLRKQIKRTRYQMELCQDLFGSNYGQQVKAWAHLQDILGQIQDQVILVEWLEKTLNQPLVSKFPILADQLWVQTQDLWQQWQPLQQTYLQPDQRHYLRSLCLQPNLS